MDVVSVTTVQSVNAFTNFPAGNQRGVCTGAIVRAYTGSINYTLDGTVATTTVGMPLLATDTTPWFISGMGPLLNMQVCSQTGTSKIVVIYISAKN